MHYKGMLKRSSKNDFAQNMFRAAETSTGEAPKPKEKNAAAVALGRLGGLKGGIKRKAALSPERRQEIASIAARKRWSEAPDVTQ